MSLADLNRTVTDQEDDHDDVDRSIKPTARTALELVAEAVVAAALTRTARHVLKSTAGRAAIVEVPAASYVGAVGLVLGRLNPEAYLHTVAEKKRKGWSEDALPHLSAGRTVLAVTHNLSLLDANVHAAADLQFKVGPPTAAMVRRVINSVTGGRARHLEDGDIAGRDLHELAAAIRPGSSAAECVHRLKRAHDSTTTPDSRTPDLDRLPLFGAAKEWTAEVLADLERILSGRVDPADIEHVLLYGPPGTGKTVLARAIAKKAGVRYFDTSVSSWFTGSDGHLDGVLKAAEAFFQTLLDNAPAIGLLDELEALPDRASLDARHREWWNSVVTGVLLMVTRVRNSGRAVLLIGATNYFDRIDGALKRPGRMGRHILVRPAETEEEVAQLFDFYLGEELEPSGLALAAGTTGCATPAQVEAWAKAARRVAREASRPLTLNDLVTQIAPLDGRSEAELLDVALHEAGHAIAALVLGFELKRVSIVQDESSAGLTTWQRRGTMQSLRDIEDQIVVILSGRAADVLLGDGPDSGARSDLQAATSMLVAAETSLGLRESLVFRSHEDAIPNLLLGDKELVLRTDRRMQELMHRAEALVRVHLDAMGATAEALVTHRMLTGQQVKEILTHAKRNGQGIAETSDGSVADHSDERGQPVGPISRLRG